MVEQKTDSNGHMNFDDLTIDGLKAIFPEAAGAPLLSGNYDSGNPGVRILSNDETITEMLKGLNFNDERQSVLCTLALGENDIFLYKDPRKAPKEAERLQKEVEKIRNRIKNRATSQCSVKGWGIDQYKQAASGVLTNTYTARGMMPLSMPLGRNRQDSADGNGSKQNTKRP